MQEDETRQQIGIPLCWLCYTGRRDKTTYRYSFMLTLQYRDDETRQQIGIPLCWLLYRDDKTRQQISIPLCWLCYTGHKGIPICFLVSSSLYSRVNIKEYLSVVLSRHLCIAESTQRNTYLLSCLVYLYSRVNKRQNNRYVFLYVDSAIQRWQDKTTDRYSFMLTLLYRDDKTKQQIGIPLCWLGYTEMTRQDNR
jgi:hypothetical protein